ncbi:MAG: porin, partial [Pseudomonadota bacterium]
MKTILKTSVAAAALMAVAAPAMATIENAQPKVTLRVYGQVNKAMLWGDDGNNARTMVVDNAASTTRWGFLATAPVNADFSFGANLEWEFSTNDSAQMAIANT